MLPFERDVVAALVSDDARQAAVEDFVDGALRSMPEYLRAGVAAESLALGTWTRLRGLVAGTGAGSLERRLESWERSRIGLVRQYVHMLRSLVLFAEAELAPGAA